MIPDAGQVGSPWELVPVLVPLGVRNGAVRVVAEIFLQQYQPAVALFLQPHEPGLSHAKRVISAIANQQRDRNQLLRIRQRVQQPAAAQAARSPPRLRPQTRVKASARTRGAAERAAQVPPEVAVDGKFALADVGAVVHRRQH